MTSAVVSYRLADATDSNDNGDFRIDTATGQIYYTGSVLDFESLTDKKQFTLDVIRTLDDNVATDQTLQYVINLRNLNDNAPTITAYEGESTDAIDTYLAAGKVGANLYEMAFAVDAEGQTIRIDFSYLFEAQVTITPQPAGATSTSGTLTGFTIMPGLVNYVQLGQALNSQDGSHRTPEDAADFAIYDSYEPFVTYTDARQGAPPQNSSIYTSAAVTLTGTQGIVVASGATGIIANFDSTDADNLEALAYSLSDSTDNNTGDSTLFDITTDGELSFKTAPSHTSGVGADNIYDITVTVDDGTNTTTYDLQIVVVP